MLLKTIQEVKAVLRISNIDDDSSLPDIASAQETYILPVIGEALADELQSAYDANSLSSKQAFLLLKIQRALAGFAYADDLSIIHAMITDGGVRRTTTDNMPAAYQWEFDGVKTTLINKAQQGLESALYYLETNKADFPSWTSSTAYTRRTRYLIKGAIEFADLYQIAQPYRTFFLLLPLMADVEAFYVSHLIGKDFFDSLKDLTSPTADEKQVIADLKKAIAHLTINNAIEKMPVRITEEGLTLPSSAGARYTSDRQAVDANTMAMQMKAAWRDGQAYLEKAKLYLNANASLTVFPTYFASSYYTAPVDPSTFVDPNTDRKIFTFIR